MNSALHEPELSPVLRRIVGALLLSLSLHAAVIGLVGLRDAGPGRFRRPPEPLQVRLRPSAPQGLSSAPIVRQTGPVPSAASVSGVAPVPGAGRLAARVASRSASAPVAVLPVPSPVDSVFYTTKQLDVLPRPETPIRPGFPPGTERQAGWVLLQLKLDETGRVLAVRVLDAEPRGVFETSAKRSFEAARFAPGRKDGRPVRSLIRIRVWYGNP